MTTRPDLALTFRTSNWVEITNLGGKNYSAAIRFLGANARHMSTVAFDGPIPSLAIKADRVPAFIAFAATKGLRAEVAA